MLKERRQTIKAQLPSLSYQAQWAKLALHSLRWVWRAKSKLFGLKEEVQRIFTSVSKLGSDTSYNELLIEKSFKEAPNSFFKGLCGQLFCMAPRNNRVDQSILNDINLE